MQNVKKRMIALAILIAALAPYQADAKTHTKKGHSEASKVDKNGTPIGDRPVLVSFFGGLVKKGAVIEYTPWSAILYLDLPCPLALADRDDFFRFADSSGVGCWAPTVGGGYKVIDRFGHEHDVPWLRTFKTAVFHTEAKTMSILEENADWFVDGDSKLDDNSLNAGHY